MNPWLHGKKMPLHQKGACDAIGCEAKRGTYYLLVMEKKRQDDFFLNVVHDVHKVFYWQDDLMAGRWF